MPINIIDVGRDMKICYEAFGDPAAPNGTILLIMGLGGTLVAWPTEFCEQVASMGYQVIRYDNRDVGQSTKFDHLGQPSFIWGAIKKSFGYSVAGPYSLKDMADDAVGLLDQLSIIKAHIVGASMGGMIAQLVAIHYPERVSSLCSIMSTTGNPGLPGSEWKVTWNMMTMGKPATEEASVESTLRMMKVLSSPKYFDEKMVAERARLAWRHSNYREGVGRQLSAIIAAEDRTRKLNGISLPTIVIHGVLDPILPLEHGRATAAAIPNSELVVIDGLAHDLPVPLYTKFAELIHSNTQKAYR